VRLETRYNYPKPSRITLEIATKALSRPVFFGDSMNIKKEYAKQLLDEDAYDDEDNLIYKYIEASEWEQNGKYQFIDVVFQDPSDGKYYSFSTGRSGSPFTDWYYELDDVSEVECVEVKQVEKVIKTWESV
jgi:hypothetical protein